MKRIAISQSNYIPWKGYFDLINSVDEFIIFDDMQYTKRDWRNRNQIKTPNGMIWLTIPVQSKGKYLHKIKDVTIDDVKWNRRHWNTLQLYYRPAKYFKMYSDVFEELYLTCLESHLSRVNYRFIVAICKMLGIKTRITWSMDYKVIEGKTKRLVDLCRQAKGTHYLSGPSAKNYIDDSEFKCSGICLEYMDYSGYRPYEQLYAGFEHRVSILDLLFNMGEQSVDYMLSFKGSSQ